MPGKKKEEKTEKRRALSLKYGEQLPIIQMLEAIRLEVRASAEETPAFRVALRGESDAISQRVLGNG